MENKVRVESLKQSKHGKRKCPACGSLNVRAQKVNGLSKNKYRCYGCYAWSGDNPDYEASFVNYSHNKPQPAMTFAEIFTKIGEGKTIKEILGVNEMNPYYLKNTNLQLSYKRVLRVLSVQQTITGIRPEDPDFRKIHVDDNDFWKIFAIINKNENKILTDVKMPV